MRQTGICWSATPSKIVSLTVAQFAFPAVLRKTVSDASKTSNMASDIALASALFGEQNCGRSEDLSRSVSELQRGGQ